MEPSPAELKAEISTLRTALAEANAYIGVLQRTLAERNAQITGAVAPDQVGVEWSTEERVERR